MGGIFVIKKIIIWITILWVLIFSSYFFGVSYYENSINHPFKLTSISQDIKIKTGDTLYSIVNSLSVDGKIKNAFIVRYYIKNKNIKISLKPGVVSINKNMSIDDFFSALKDTKEEVDVDTLKITIPEGYDMNQIAKLFEDKGLISKDEFIKSCKDYILPDYIKNDTKRRYALEGFLFPDTYIFKKGAIGSQYIDIMIARFENILSQVRSSQTKTYTDEEIDKIIIMASIVEKEIVKEDERKLASSVFYNRLSKNMQLQSCATVLYALGVHKDIVSTKDLEFVSPYNTYLVKALPQGPICSPGRASIEAAFAPASTNYLYFVSKNDGSHEFNDNYNAHVAATNKYQK